MRTLAGRMRADDVNRRIAQLLDLIYQLRGKVVVEQAPQRVVVDPAGIEDKHFCRRFALASEKIREQEAQ